MLENPTIPSRLDFHAKTYEGVKYDGKFNMKNTLNINLKKAQSTKSINSTFYRLIQLF